VDVLSPSYTELCVSRVAAQQTFSAPANVVFGDMKQCGDDSKIEQACLTLPENVTVSKIR